MRRYETIYIMRPNIGEDGISGIIARTNGVIEKMGGHIVQLDRWGLKKLAYMIKKENQGFYIYSEYAGTPEAVDEIERLFRIDDKVLKYLTVKLQDVFVAGEITKAAETDTEQSREDFAADTELETDDEDDDEDDDESAE